MSELEEQAAAPETPPDESVVSIHQSTPDRFVFTERGNTDAWIATDLTVDIEK